MALQTVHVFNKGRDIYMAQKKISNLEKEKFKEVMNDPAKWAFTFLKVFNPQTKKEEPWQARWYQTQMLRDKSIKKVYRCGRRIGKFLPVLP